MKIEEYTDNGIAYYSNLSGPNGADYFLFPVKGKYTPEDLFEAKMDLKHNFDVTGITVISYEQEEDETVKFVCSKCGSDRVTTTVKGVSVYANELRVKDAHKKKGDHNFCNSCSKYVKLNKTFTLTFKEPYNNY